MEKNQTYKLLDPKNDYVFHTLFREKNNRLTEAFLASVLKEKVKIIANLDRHLDISKVTDKFGIMDLNVELEDNTKCNIEMQVKEYDGELERFLYYLANSYSRQLKKNVDYAEINRCINITIVNHEIKELNDIENFVTKWAMIETETKSKILTNKFELYIIILPKVAKNYEKDQKDKLTQWGMFFAKPYSKEVKSIMEENKDIQAIADELEILNGDYEAQRLADIREKALHDEAAALSYAKKHGLEQGIKEGLEQGIKQGLKQGLKQAQEQAKENMLKTAKILLKKGMSVEDIIEATGLTKEEILKLKY